MLSFVSIVIRLWPLDDYDGCSRVVKDEVATCDTKYYIISMKVDIPDTADDGMGCRLSRLFWILVGTADRRRRGVFDFAKEGKVGKVEKIDRRVLKISWKN